MTRLFLLALIAGLISCGDEKPANSVAEDNWREAQAKAEKLGGQAWLVSNVEKNYELLNQNKNANFPHMHSLKLVLEQKESSKYKNTIVAVYSSSGDVETMQDGTYQALAKPIIIEVYDAVTTTVLRDLVYSVSVIDNYEGKAAELALFNDETDVFTPLAYLPKATARGAGYLTTNSIGNGQIAVVATLASLDTQPPITKIADGGLPPANTNSRTAVFNFESDDPNAAYQCQLDHGPIVDCENTVTFEDLADGEHTLIVWSIDENGNIDPNGQEYTWNVDATPANINIVIDQNDVTSTTDLVIDFIANENVTYECAINSDVFQNCESSIEVNNLSDGTHTVTVRATDEVGNVSTSSYEITIDTTDPELSLEIETSTVTNSTAQEFEFTSSDATNIEFTCSLDGAGEVDCQDGYAVTDLAEGEHTLLVKATDEAGNSITETITWVIDTTDPELSLEIETSTVTNSTAQEFEFTSSDATNIEFTCSLDGAGEVDCQDGYAVTDLAEGEHTLLVKATDEAGNSITETITWVIDTTDPELSLEIETSTVTNSTAQEFVFTSSDATNIEFTCSLDGAGEVDCQDGYAVTDLAEGEHTLLVKATDEAGNSITEEITWTIDTTPPVTNVLSSVPTVTSSISTTFTFASTDANNTEYSCSYDGGVTFECSSPYTITNITEGVHTFVIYTVDEAGNAATEETSYQWTVDFTDPVLFGSGESGSTNNQELTFTFGATDNTDVVYQCKLDGGAAELCSSPWTITVTTEGSHTLTILSEDLAGNEGLPLTFNFFSDWTPPVVVGLPGQTIYTDSNIIEFSWNTSDNSSYSHVCTIDSEPAYTCTSPQVIDAEDGWHTLVLTSLDSAGNTTSSTYGWYVDTVDPIVNAPNLYEGKVTNGVVEFGTSETMPVQTFCSIDQGETYVDCSNGFDTSELSSFFYRFYVKVTDIAGNTSEVNTFDIVVENDGPTIDMYVKPNLLSGEVDPVFGLACEYSNCQLYCSIDSGPAAACSNIVEYKNISLGEHTFEVTSVHPVYGQGSTSWSWNYESERQETAKEAFPFVFNTSTGKDGLCMLSHGGDVFCKGDGRLGQRGDGSLSSSNNWTRTLLPTKVIRLFQTGSSFCALLILGDLYCWGYEAVDLVGSDNRVEDPTKLEIPSLEKIRYISKGSDTNNELCVITVANEIFCRANYQGNSAGYMVETGSNDLYWVEAVGLDVFGTPSKLYVENRGTIVVNFDGSSYGIGRQGPIETAFSSFETLGLDSSDLNIDYLEPTSITLDRKPVVSVDRSYSSTIFRTIGNEFIHYGYNNSTQFGNHPSINEFVDSRNDLSDVAVGYQGYCYTNEESIPFCTYRRSKRFINDSFAQTYLYDVSNPTIGAIRAVESTKGYEFNQTLFIGEDDSLWLAGTITRRQTDSYSFNNLASKSTDYLALDVVSYLNSATHVSITQADSMTLDLGCSHAVCEYYCSLNAAGYSSCNDGDTISLVPGMNTLEITATSHRQVTQVVATAYTLIVENEVSKQPVDTPGCYLDENLYCKNIYGNTLAERLDVSTYDGCYLSNDSLHCGEKEQLELPVTSFSSAGYSSCYIQEGKVNCRGPNRPGNLFSSDDYFYENTFTALDYGNWLTVEVGQSHSCAISSDTSLWCAGSNEYGALAQSGEVTRGVITHLDAGNYRVVAVIRNATCGITNSGDVNCWGINNVGQTGVTTNTNTAVDGTKFNLTSQHVLSNITELDGKGEMFCASNVSEDIYCWGRGITMLAKEHEPVLVGQGSNISVGDNSVCFESLSSVIECVQ